ncbi:EAL domain-containing protein [Svornostia abyssi]|uniref:EAL domain-containing protein n=1 Tax=Svornostia abyssi TaxID=2898438 RepID=A0ABY5PL37_9ACTN|nr:EAL domain-containing protein [Parviterribacteraceae bacterium J379]
MTHTISVLLAEDDEQMRMALTSFIATEPGFLLVGAVADAQEAIDLSRSLQPDVVLVDVNMPGGGGARATREIRRRVPTSRVLALSAANDRATVLEMLEAGAAGYLVKGGPVQEISDAIRRAATGRASLSADVAGEVVDELAGELQLRRRRERRMTSRLARVRGLIDDPAGMAIALQPVCELERGAPVGYEALARFDGRPPRPPDHWFRAAGTVGVAEELELVALERALRRLDELPDGAFLSLNGSPSTFACPAARRLLAEAATDRLVLEITEHAPVADYDALAADLRPLRDRGARVAIDDAGAGFASLRHILRLSPDVIKLDRSLVSGISRDRAQQALAGGLISFAEKMGALIVAEGIELAEELGTLRELGVRYGQGFLLARPTSSPLRAAAS